jgi:hypothetical protein
MALGDIPPVRESFVVEEAFRLDGRGWKAAPAISEKFC